MVTAVCCLPHSPDICMVFYSELLIEASSNLLKWVDFHFLKMWAQKDEAASLPLRRLNVREQGPSCETHELATRSGCRIFKTLPDMNLMSAVCWLCPALLWIWRLNLVSLWVGVFLVYSKVSRPCLSIQTGWIAHLLALNSGQTCCWFVEVLPCHWVVSSSTVYELFAFISHMGTSTMSGHYVCHIKKEGRWVFFRR